MTELKLELDFHDSVSFPCILSFLIIQIWPYLIQP